MKAPRRGDMIMLDFDPQAGHEQQKRRPALVISDTQFNELGLAVVCPVTSKAPRHNFHLALPKGLKTSGYVMTEQLKSLDYHARKAQFIEELPIGFIHQVRRIIAEFI